MTTARSLGIASLLFISLTECLAGVIIDRDHLNGSFESGVLSPWGGRGSLVLSNSELAVDGTWFAQAGAPLNPSGTLTQRFPAVSAGQPDFYLSFYARTSPGGFSDASGYLFGHRSSDSNFLYATVVQSETAPLTDTEWTHFSYLLRFDEPWDMSQPMGVGVTFGWDAHPSMGSIGYFDQVTLVQVPEASTPALLIVGGVVLCARRLVSRGRVSLRLNTNVHRSQDRTKRCTE